MQKKKQIKIQKQNEKTKQNGIRKQRGGYMKFNPFDKYLTGETALQIAVCDYIRLQYPRLVVHHSPNEAKRSPFVRYLIKRMGLSPGFPDLMIVNIKTDYYQFLELKYGDNIPTTEQMEWLILLSEQSNTECFICWSLESAKYFIDSFHVPIHTLNRVYKYNGIYIHRDDLIPKKFMKLINKGN